MHFELRIATSSSSLLHRQRSASYVLARRGGTNAAGKHVFCVLGACRATHRLHGLALETQQAKLVDLLMLLS